MMDNPSLAGWLKPGDSRWGSLVRGSDYFLARTR